MLTRKGGETAVNRFLLIHVLRAYLRVPENGNRQELPEKSRKQKKGGTPQLARRVNNTVGVTTIGRNSCSDFC